MARHAVGHKKDCTIKDTVHCTARTMSFTERHRAQSPEPNLSISTAMGDTIDMSPIKLPPIQRTYSSIYKQIEHGPCFDNATDKEVRDFVLYHATEIDNDWVQLNHVTLQNGCYYVPLEHRNDFVLCVHAYLEGEGRYTLEDITPEKPKEMYVQLSQGRNDHSPHILPTHWSSSPISMPSERYKKRLNCPWDESLTSLTIDTLDEEQQRWVRANWVKVNDVDGTYVQPGTGITRQTSFVGSHEYLQDECIGKTLLKTAIVRAASPPMEKPSSRLKLARMPPASN